MAKPVQAGWDNHFAAFGAQDVNKILLDYTECSQVIVYDALCDEEVVYRGLDDIRKCFTGLFATLSDLKALAAPVIKVEEAPFASVFLQWMCPSSGIIAATDTFFFDENGKIVKQNVVVWPEKKNPGAGGQVKASCTLPTGGNVQKGWDNHFAAFGAQDVEKILLDYTEKSVVVVSDAETGKLDTYTGLEEIKKCFVGLFGALSNISDLGAPCIKVEEWPAPQVFLIWHCPASKVTKCTDTFMFDKEGKIVKQFV
eukprot:CAMPEP_0181308158 /NCGR_PEP_ID=MMETSP1101-20121128/11300_1 /TAXON_ID=46948 /ORGANISM="Rhodomonas abbreviata, Strain Caron Lab Isolate" /LENGTH=254 /DNA_ID=CAMNT_0023414495 /DNA_START=901 /DNA_END=1661 /DNA_ORIENTATION=-